MSTSLAYLYTQVVQSVAEQNSQQSDSEVDILICF